MIVPDPYWVSYPPMVDIAGGTSIKLPCPQSQGFKITPDQLEAAITPKTKWVILNSPSNPTGSMYSAEELWQLAQVLVRAPHVMVMSDDIYEHIVFDGHSFVSIVDGEPELKERALIVNGVSKAYSMTGWRIGYGAGPQWLIKAMGKLQSQSTSNACSIAQAAALEALTGPQDFLKDWVQEFQDRRDYIVNALNTIDGFSCIRPAGTFYAYPSCDGLLGKRTPEGDRLTTDTDVAAFLLDSVGVALVPGSAFGRSPHLRLSYAVSKDVLEDAVTRLKKAVNQLT